MVYILKDVFIYNLQDVVNIHPHWKSVNRQAPNSKLPQVNRRETWTNPEHAIRYIIFPDVKLVSFKNKFKQIHIIITLRLEAETGF